MGPDLMTDIAMLYRQSEILQDLLLLCSLALVDLFNITYINYTIEKTKTIIKQNKSNCNLNEKNKPKSNLEISLIIS